MPFISKSSQGGLKLVTLFEKVLYTNMKRKVREETLTEAPDPRKVESYRFMN